MEGTKPLTSIRSYLDRELRVCPVEDGYELRHEDDVLGSLGDPRFAAEVPCATLDGQWRFTRRRGGNCEASAGTAIVARYESSLLPGGTIELGDESRFRLRPPVTGETWKLRRGRRDVVLEIAPLRHGWALRLKPGARDVYELPLLAMFAFHAVQVEIDRPTGGPDAPSAG